MKRILVITGTNSLNNEGGVEKYLRNIYKIKELVFQELFYIDSMNKLGDDKIKREKIINKELNKKIEEINPDVIYINHEPWVLKHISSINITKYRIIFRDHNQFLKRTLIKSSFVKNMYLSSIKDKLSRCELITFTQEDATLWKRFINFKKTYLMPLFVNKTIHSQPRDISDPYVFIGRNKKVKNVSEAIKISKHCGRKIVVIGRGHNNNFQHVENLGHLNKDEVINKMENKSFLLVTSKTEGFSFVAMEAISSGLPIIMKNSFPAAKFIIGNNERGILYNNFHEVPELIKNMSKSKYNQLIKNVEIFKKNAMSDAQYRTKIEKIFN